LGGSQGVFTTLATTNGRLPEICLVSNPGPCHFVAKIMYYKLSAIELELLARDRRKILRQFQENQETRRKSLKPPILVVPYEESELICFITRDQEDEEYSNSSESTTDDNKTPLSKIHKFGRRFCSFIKGRFSRSVTEVKVHDRSIKKHQKRLSSGAATRIPYPGLSEALRGASGTLIGTSLELHNYHDSVLSEIVPLLGTKCDVCVLSEETQVFRLVDAILESNLWPLAEDFEDDLEEPEEDDRASNHHGEKTRQNNAVTANEASADENIEATAAHFFIDSDHD